MLLTKYFEFPPASHFHCQADHGWHSKEQGDEGALERFLWLLLPFIVNMRSQCCNLKSKASVAPSVQQSTALSQANTSALTILTSVVMATLVAATSSPNLAKYCCRCAVTLHYNPSFTFNWKTDVTDLPPSRRLSTPGCCSSSRSWTSQDAPRLSTLKASTPRPTASRPTAPRRAQLMRSPVPRPEAQATLNLAFFFSTSTPQTASTEPRSQKGFSSKV